MLTAMFHPTDATRPPGACLRPSSRAR